MNWEPNRPKAVALPKVKKLAKLGVQLQLPPILQTVRQLQALELDDGPRLQPDIVLLIAAVFELAARAAGARFVARWWHRTRGSEVRFLSLEVSAQILPVQIRKSANHLEGEGI